MCMCTYDVISSCVGCVSMHTHPQWVVVSTDWQSDRQSIYQWVGSGSSSLVPTNPSAHSLTHRLVSVCHSLLIWTGSSSTYCWQSVISQSIVDINNMIKQYSECRHMYAYVSSRAIHSFIIACCCMRVRQINFIYLYTFHTTLTN